MSAAPTEYNFGIAEPGEQVQVRATIHSNGSADASGATAPSGLPPSKKPGHDVIVQLLGFLPARLLPCSLVLRVSMIGRLGSSGPFTAPHVDMSDASGAESDIA